MTSNPNGRDLARDIRSDTIGEVMATPGQAGISTFWLRPVGGGYEWQVPPRYVQIIKRAEAAA
ncbi:hypothetical protein ABIA35_006002 [Catenulispora sp. MAP12-49]|uniref:hypothetical protein n=1 Tax=Catenulispora sp. MAP12-49 TaxID=3156302 RepID=UPI003511691C